MDVKLDKQSKIPVYLQIVDQLRAQIMCGALPSGSVLPSERGLAQMLEVHRNTVVKAYGELKSDAWIESRQGIGYVVAVPPAAEDGGEGEAGASDKPSRRVNWINEIKDRYLDMKRPLTIFSSALPTRANTPSAAASPPTRCSVPSALRTTSRR